MSSSSAAGSPERASGPRSRPSAGTLIIEAEEHCAMHCDRALGRLLAGALWRNADHSADHGVTPIRCEQGWPTGERSWLRQRGAIVDRPGLPALVGRDERRNRRRRRGESSSIATSSNRAVPGIREGWDFGLHDPTCADIDVAGLHNACLAQFRAPGRGADALDGAAVSPAARRSMVHRSGRRKADR